MDELPSFKALLMSYSQSFLAQVLQCVACNALHSIEERYARWLLMTHDRVGQHTFHLTQEYLAEMLGVSRASVNLVALKLHRAGLVRYTRGKLTILSRAGLEEFACECYGLIRRQYDQRLPGALS